MIKCVHVSDGDDYDDNVDNDDDDYHYYYYQNSIVNNTLIAEVPHPAKDTSRVTHTTHMITPGTCVVAFLRAVLTEKAIWTSW